MTPFFRLFERSNCVLLLLMSTGFRIKEEEEESGKEKKNEKIGDSSMLRNVSIVREARLVNNLSRREAEEN